MLFPPDPSAGLFLQVGLVSFPVIFLLLSSLSRRESMSRKCDACHAGPFGCCLRLPAKQMKVTELPKDVLQLLFSGLDLPVRYVLRAGLVDEAAALMSTRLTLFAD